MTTKHICWVLTYNLCCFRSPSGNVYNRLIALGPVKLFVSTRPGRYGVRLAMTDLSTGIKQKTPYRSKDNSNDEEER